MRNAAGYHPGSVAPSTNDQAQLNTTPSLRGLNIICGCSIDEIKENFARNSKILARLPNQVVNKNYKSVIFLSGPVISSPPGLLSSSLSLIKLYFNTQTEANSGTAFVKLKKLSKMLLGCVHIRHV